MLHRCLTTFLVLAAGLAPVSVAGASARSQEDAAVAPEVRDRIEERCRAFLIELVDKGLPGASVGIVLPDGSELAVAVGFADVEAEEDLTPEHRLLSGSVGKTYVTAAAHHLIQTGKLSLDERAAEHFEGEDWFARVPNAEEITVRQLLRHQTGIPRYVFDEAFWERMVADRDHVWQPEELLAYVFDAEPLFAAGEGWAYADTNYIVVGMILERVSGERFYDYVRENLLAPHGLDDTVPTDSRQIDGLAQGYVYAMKQLVEADHSLEDGVFVINPQFEWCGGGYASTPLDLARWARILYTGAAFEGPYLDTMLDAVPAPMLGPGRSYGLGVIVTESELGTVHGHDGIMVGYLTAMGHLPEHGVTVALQVNSDSMGPVRRPPFLVMLDLARIAVEELGG